MTHGACDPSIGIVQVTHYMPPHPGGIERVAETLFRAYGAAGLAVEWIASRVPRYAPSREGGRRRVACVNILETALGVPVPLWGPGAVRVLAAAVRAADVVHVHDCLYPGTALAMRLARRYSRPTILTQHVGFVRYRSHLLNACERAAYATMGRRLLRQASQLVMATPAAETWIRDLLGGIPPQACAIPNGIDLGAFQPADADARRAARAALGLDNGAPVVLFAGRLVEKKGVPLVLEVARRFPRAQFLIVGDGPLAPLLRETPANVRWIRSVPPRKMARHYQAADCLLLPSTGEGLPLVVQEALACAIPAVVADDEPYAAALAETDVVVVAPRQPDAMAARVEAACRMPTPGLQERARRYAEKYWDVEVMTRRYIDLVRGLAMASTQPVRRPA